MLRWFHRLFRPLALLQETPGGVKACQPVAPLGQQSCGRFVQSVVYLITLLLLYTSIDNGAAATGTWGADRFHRGFLQARFGD